MFWFLLALLVVLSVVVLAVSVLSLWGRVKVLGRELGAAAAAAEQLSAAFGELPSRAPATCPTCGGPNPPVTPRAPARSR